MPQQRTYQQIVEEARRKQQRRPSLWERANTPLTDIFSRTAKKAKDFIFQPTDNWMLKELQGVIARETFGGMAFDVSGSMADSMTSPASLALTATGAGTLTRLPAAINVARKVQQGISAAGVAHGGYKMADAATRGVPEQNLSGLVTGERPKDTRMGDFGAGLLEAGLSGIGLHPRFLPRAIPKGSSTPAPKTNIPDARYIPRELRERANSLGMTDEQMSNMSREQVMKGVRSLEYAKRKLNPKVDIPEPPEKSYVTMTNQRLRQLQKEGDRQAATELRTRRRMKKPEDFYSESTFPPKGEGVDFFAPIEAAGKGQPKRGNPFHRRTGNPAFDRAHADWVNERRAASVRGDIVRRDFADLDAEGLEGILKYQDGVRTGRFKDVQSYFDDMHRQVSEKIGNFNFKDHYLPQLWEESADKVKDAFRRVGMRPSFTLGSTIENYRTGIALGLTPKFKTISQLAGWYEKTARKTLADVKYFQMLRDKGWIRTKATAGNDWETLNPDHFPVYFSDFGQQIYQAPKPVAEAINNYLVPRKGITKWFADKNSILKNVILSSGLPKTGINWHGFSIASRAFEGGGIKNYGKALKYLVRPSKAEDDLLANIKKLPDAVDHGLTATTEEHVFGQQGSLHLLREPRTNVGKAANKALNVLLEKHGKWFEDPLFQKILPALKLQHWEKISKELIKKGLDEDAAKRAAAEATNSLYGGINWEQIQRSPGTQDLMRALLLAPDWLETQYRIPKGMALALRDPKNPLAMNYKRIAANTVKAYLAIKATNYLINGTLEQPPGYDLAIRVGEAGGKERHVMPLTSSTDFLKLPLDIVTGLVQGDLSSPVKLFKNRLSALAGFGGSMAFNVDDFGRPILGKDNFGRPQSLGEQLGNVGAEIADITTPQYVASFIDFIRGRVKSPEEAVFGGVEFPLRYRNPSGTQRRRQRRRRRNR